MKVLITKIRRSPIEIHEELKNIDLGKDSILTSPAVLTGKMTIGTADEVYFKGHIFANVLLTCVMCLAKFKKQFEIDFEETYLPKSMSDVGVRERKLSKKNLNTFVYYGNYINTTEIARELLIEAIPPYPLCPKCRKLDNS